MAETLDQIAADANRILDLGRKDPHRTIPRYPDWSSLDMIEHLAMVYARTHVVCQTMPSDRVKAPRRPPDSDPFAWFEVKLAQMLKALGSAEPTARVWTFSVEKTMAFWPIRMLVETGVHRWDMEQAFGNSVSLPPMVVRAGLDEFGSLWLPRMREVSQLQIEADELDETWVFGSDVSTSSVTGKGSDIFLRLMSRGDFELPVDWATAVDELAEPERP